MAFLCAQIRWAGCELSGAVKFASLLLKICCFHQFQKCSIPNHIFPQVYGHATKQKTKQEPENN